MKRLVLLLSLFFVLTGCNFNNDELTFSAIKLAEANGDVKRFIDHMETTEDGTGNGIYVFNDTGKRFYLYLSREFLDDGKSFGEVDVNAEDDSLNIYLNENSANEKEDPYKLYKIHLDKEYKFLKVFKNGEETYIETMGV